MNKFPEEMEKQIIQTAAKLTGKHPDELTTEEAAIILKDGYPDPTINMFVDKWTEQAVDDLMEDFTDERINDIEANASNRRLQKDLANAIFFMAESVQEATADEGKEPTPEEDQGEGDLLLDAARGYAEYVRALMPYVWELVEPSPFLQEELEKPEYEGKTLPELIDEVSRTDLPLVETRFFKVMKGARDAMWKALRNFEEADKPLQATAKRAQSVEYPLDKPNSLIWRLLEKDTAGQVSFNMAKNKSRDLIPAYYAINFDDLGEGLSITKRLLPFDKRVYIAVSALHNAGNNVITLPQIYYAMGNAGRPNRTQLEKINNSVTKMTNARIYFDNEHEATRYKYQHFRYDGSLLPLERRTALINGQLADAAIHIFREPPLITFAKQRRQITTISIDLLKSPISKTDANLLLDDYLIERISKAKNGRTRHCRVLFKTIYEHCNIATKKQKQRAPEKVTTYLTHYRKTGFISNFTIDDNERGVTVYW